MDGNISNSEHKDLEYIEKTKNESRELTFRYRDYLRHLHTLDLIPCSVDSYYDSLKDRQTFPYYKEPKKAISNKKAGITLRLKLKSFIFSKAKKELANREKIANQMYDKENQAEIVRYKIDKDIFYRQQKQQHEEIDERLQSFINGDVNEVSDYFKYVLYSDTYSTNFRDDYPIQVEDLKYDVDSSTLSLKYKIPTEEEMLLCNRFEFNQEFNEIVPSPMDKKERELLRKEITQKVLTRVLQLLYLSDNKNKLKNVSITGFFEYFDDSFGRIRRKDVIKLYMSKDDFNQTDFFQVRVNSLFDSRLKPKKSKGIYSLKSTDVKELQK
jgi:hypothetical protein